MKIIVDMMGGDNAPLAVLEGAAQAVKEYGVQLIGVGNEALVRKTAAEHNIPLDGIELVNCTETIERCPQSSRLICCWTAVPTWSAARRCWPPLRSWAAAM